MKIVFALLFLGGMLALLFEVINPHSALGTTGAFIRVFLLAVTTGYWFYSVKKSHPRLYLPGLILLICLGVSYVLYGFGSLCGNLHFEETSQNPEVEKPYSCPSMLKEFFF
jgi:hypothetical protein